MDRIACAIIRRTRIILLTPIGRLLPLTLMIILSVGIPVLVPLALMAIPAIGIPVLVPLALMAIPAVGIPVLAPLALVIIPTIAIAAGLVPLTVLAIPTIRIAARLLPLTLMAIPAVGIAAGLLPLMRLTIPAVSKGTRLGPVESLTMRLRGKRTIRSGLGAQGAQRHKQTHRENNAPPSFWSHLIVLLKKILDSGFVCNLEGRPREKVNEFFRIFKNSIVFGRKNLEVRAGRNRVGVASKEFQ
jgi:hypothetical protein